MLRGTTLGVIGMTGLSEKERAVVRAALSCYEDGFKSVEKIMNLNEKTEQLRKALKAGGFYVDKGYEEIYK